MSEITEIDVLKLAKEQIKIGYTNKAYITVDDMGEDFTSHRAEQLAAQTGEYVAVCAIGGVEHAIWKLTGQSVRNNRSSARKTEATPSNNETVYLYRKVMARLNRLARQYGGSFTEQEYDWNNTYKDVEVFTYPEIESINVELAPDESKPIILKLIDKAIAQAKREAKREAKVTV